MLKKSLILTLGIFSQTAFAEQWVLAAEDDLLSIYVDKDSVEAIYPNELYRISEKRIFHKDESQHQIAKDDIDFAHEYIDCKNGYYGIYMNFAFDKDLNMKFYTPEIPVQDINMYPVLSDSIGKKLNEFICNNTF